MKCADCPYCWKDEGDKYPHCHYGYDDGYAPCEVEDSGYEQEDETYGEQKGKQYDT